MGTGSCPGANADVGSETLTLKGPSYLQQALLSHSGPLFRSKPYLFVGAANLTPFWMGTLTRKSTVTLRIL